MSIRRDARTKTTPVSDTSVIPVELRAGACLEVWAPGDHWKAHRRWRQARDEWLMAHGIHSRWSDHADIPAVLRRGVRMWSYEFLLERDPERLASMLVCHALPPDWSPGYVETYDYGPSLVSESMTWQTYKQLSAMR